jgi:hypothetical protein
VQSDGAEDASSGRPSIDLAGRRFWGWGVPRSPARQWPGAASKQQHARSNKQQSTIKQLTALRPRVFVRNARGDVINSALSPNNEVMQMTKAPLTAYQAALRARMSARKDCLSLERYRRPRPNMGWNKAPGDRANPPTTNGLPPIGGGFSDKDPDRRWRNFLYRKDGVPRRPGRARYCICRPFADASVVA